MNKRGGTMMSKGMGKLVAGGLVVITIGGVCYNIGYNNNTSPPTYKTEIVQTQDDEIKINYKEIIVEELHEEAQLIICSNKMIIPMTFEENHWYGDKTQDIEFSAMGKWIIDFSKITSDNVVINENNKEITIYMSKPIKEVRLLEEETAFGEVKKGMFVFGDIVHTPEEYEGIKHNVKCQALTKMIDMDEQAEKTASNSIEKILYLTKQNNYDIKIIFIK